MGVLTACLGSLQGSLVNASGVWYYIGRKGMYRVPDRLFPLCVQVQGTPSILNWPPDLFVWRWEIDNTPGDIEIVTLPDGYNGHTERYYRLPLEIDGDLALVLHVDSGYMKRWALIKDIARETT